ncbi:MAG TPA: O-antigen ligase family protein [Hellea balneolensis]|uniref:O-antigen ligase family protein n=1 Tax=Hellea balneolensis TaxID=287478 RepID=A0A7V5NW87_9PROT|nr:O-antigen ligase family protein [Hellea balneolensis]
MIGGTTSTSDERELESRIAARNHTVGKLLYWAEEIIVFILLFQFSTALVALLTVDPNDLESQSILARYLWYPGYILVLLLALRHFGSLLRMAAFNPLIVLAVLWCGVTYIWSIAPDVTLRRSVALLVTTLFGLVLAARYDWNQLVQRLAFVFLVTALISLFLAVAIPSLGRMQDVYVGAWRGAWLEKNSFGTRMAMGLTAMMAAFAMQPKRWWLWVPGGILCFFLIIMCQSKAALLAALVAISGFFVIRLFRRFPLLRIPVMYGVIMTVAVGAFLIIVMPDEMFALIGKDRTLTGRTDIWNLLIEAIRQKPWLGYGYGTFWEGLQGPSYWIRFDLDWGVPTAHNGWMETWLSAGLVGVAIFGLLYLLTVLLALDRLYRGGVENYWVILSTVLFFMISMSESQVLQQNDLSWVMFVATTAKLFSFSPAWWRNRPKTPYFQPPPHRRAWA